MKPYEVTIHTTIMAESEQAAWEYGHALASKAPSTVANGVDDYDKDTPAIEVAEAK